MLEMNLDWILLATKKSEAFKHLLARNILLFKEQYNYFLIYI